VKAVSNPTADLLHSFDNPNEMTRNRRRALFTIGFGEFVDGYDIIVIGGALLQLKEVFHLDTSETGALPAVAFVGTAIGAAVFGTLTDRVGRRTVFTFTLIAFIVFSLLSAIVTDVQMLFVIRFLVGLAIGADITASMSFLAEISPRSSRGRWTGSLPNVAWSIGALCALLTDFVLYSTAGGSAWRWMLGVAAIPALILIYFRRALPESPRWLLLKGRFPEALEAFRTLGMVVPETFPQTAPQVEARAQERQPEVGSYIKMFRRPNTGRALLVVLIMGLAPFAGGGASIMAPYAFSQLGHLSDAVSVLAGGIFWAGCAVGTFIGWKATDRIGRIRLLLIGFIGQAVVYVLMAFLYHAAPAMLLPLYFLVGVLQYIENVAIWSLVGELLPTAIRGRAQGAAHCMERVALAVTVYLFPTILASYGFRDSAVIFAICGIVLATYATFGRRYEPVNKSVEDASSDTIGAQASIDTLSN
jgi:putative MFS transporter